MRVKGVVCCIFIVMLLCIRAGENRGENLGRMVEHAGDRESKIVVFGFFRANRPDEKERVVAVEAMITRTYPRNNVVFVRIALGETDSSVAHLSRDQESMIRYGHALKEMVDQDSRLTEKELSIGGGKMVLIVDQYERIHYAETSYEPSVVLRKVEAVLMATKVDESTWGKIKELFR